jgi:hypothetical protein
MKATFIDTCDHILLSSHIRSLSEKLSELSRSTQEKKTLIRPRLGFGYINVPKTKFGLGYWLCSLTLAYVTHTHAFSVYTNKQMHRFGITKK